MRSSKLFLDTFALGKVAADPGIAESVRQYIRSRGWILILSTLNLVEIYPVRSLWTPVANFISSLPFCIARGTDSILRVEMSSYPYEVELPVGFRSWDYVMTQAELKSAIETNMRGKISYFASEWRREKEEVWQALLDNKKTFPPEQNGKYSDFQRWLFLQKNVLMFALMQNKGLVNGWRDEGEEIKIERFKSYYVIVLGVFLEYYVQGKLGRASDIGDFYQLSYAPYVDLAVFDNERNDLLQKINRMETPPGLSLSGNCKVMTRIALPQLGRWLLAAHRCRA